MSLQETHRAIPTALPDFAAFFRAEFPRVVTGLMKAGATCEEAEDAAQEAMQALLFKLPTCKRPAGWVRTVAWHAYCKKAERDRQRVALESQIAHTASSVPQDRIEPDEHAWVLRLLRGLPHRQGQVLALYLDDYSTEEIGELLKMKVGTVRSNLRHARTTLRSSLESYADEAGSEIRGKEEGGGPHARKE